MSLSYPAPIKQGNNFCRSDYLEQSCRRVLSRSEMRGTSSCAHHVKLAWSMAACSMVRKAPRHLKGKGVVKGKGVGLHIVQPK